MPKVTIYQHPKTGFMNAEVGPSEDIIRRVGFDRTFELSHSPKVGEFDPLWTVGSILEQYFSIFIDVSPSKEVSSNPNNQRVLEHWVTVSHFGSIEINKQKGSSDFFDLLRELNETASRLSEHIRGINDPSVKTPAVKAARAYLDAVQLFTDLEDNEIPEEIPSEIRSGVLGSLKRVNWLSVSDQANKWAQAIIRIFENISKAG